MEKKEDRGRIADGLNLKPAPVPLAPVQRFVNTKNVVRGYDLLEDIEGASDWLSEHGFLDGGARVDEEDRSRLLRQLEEPLRELVHDGRVRRAGQDARLPASQVALRQSPRRAPRPATADRTTATQALHGAGRRELGEANLLLDAGACLRRWPASMVTRT